MMRDRFIPAHAGNTAISFANCFSVKVHPRSRGEYNYIPVIVKALQGSSPLTRGIRKYNIEFDWDSRFIPAHAGNTLKKALFYLTFSNTHFHISFNF